MSSRLRPWCELAAPRGRLDNGGMRWLGLLVLLVGCDTVFGLHRPDGPEVDAAPMVGSWTAVALGGHHACGLKTDGSLWCWGRNDRGVLGVASLIEEPVPRRIGSARWESITGHADHVCGVQADHTLWCWGTNYYGQLGLGDAAERGQPMQVVRVSELNAEVW